MLKSSRKLVNYFILLTTLLTVLEHTNGAPTGQVSKTTLFLPREAAFGGQPQKVHTEKTTVTAQGPVTEICDISLTPIQAPDGTDMVREDRLCVVAFKSSVTVGAGAGDGSNTNTQTSTDSNTSSSDSSTSVESDTSTADTATVSQANSGNTSGDNGATILSTGSVDAASINTAASAAATDSASGVAIVSTGAVDTGVALPTGAVGSTGSALGDSNGASATATTSDSASGTAAAASSSAAAFQLPGTKLSVLPIGLAVFAGVSVIALIVVGLVTYERTKYRRAFRQRRLAEQGGAPAMSERS